MRNAFIFHGTGGHPEENWFPWMKEELQSLGLDVHIPQFPTPDNQTLETWFDVFKKYEKDINDRTIMIGHSLGGAFLLRVLERVRTQITAAFFISAPVGVRPIKNWDGDQPFIGHPFDWETIKGLARHFSVFHSDDDPYVSLGNGEKTAQELGIPLTFIPNAGHFNAATGYVRFDALLEQIRKVLEEDTSHS